MNVAVGGIVAVGVIVGVTEGIGVALGVSVDVAGGVTVGPNSCPGPQPASNRLVIRRQRDRICTFMFISSHTLAITGGPSVSILSRITVGHSLYVPKWASATCACATLAISI